LPHAGRSPLSRSEPAASSVLDEIDDEQLKLEAGDLLLVDRHDLTDAMRRIDDELAGLENRAAGFRLGAADWPAPQQRSQPRQIAFRRRLLKPRRLAATVGPFRSLGRSGATAASFSDGVRSVVDFAVTAWPKELPWSLAARYGFSRRQVLSAASPGSLRFVWRFGHEGLSPRFHRRFRYHESKIH